MLKFLRDWTLPISMIVGVLAYFFYVSIPALDSTHETVADIISVVQPALIFLMLFLSFCKVDPRDLHPRIWHLYLLLIQLGLFVVMGLFLYFYPDTESRVLVESAMLCLVCPTATAASVVTQKLDGNAATIVTYTIVINIAVSIAVPAILPLAHPQEGLSFLPCFWMIICKVFPLMIMPLVTAWMVRFLLPSIHRLCLSCKDLAFYLWAVALALAIAVTVKAMAHSSVSISYEIGIAFVSLLCCLFQFWAGKRLGAISSERIEGGQALGQKNTVLAIWMGYTFMSPVTAMVGGFYSVWHNVINSYQLYEKRKHG